MNTDRPIWQLPGKNLDAVHENSKYHCFIDNKSLCNKYKQDTQQCYTTIESGEIVMMPHIACKACYEKWKKRYSIN